MSRKSSLLNYQQYVSWALIRDTGHLIKPHPRLRCVVKFSDVSSLAD